MHLCLFIKSKLPALTYIDQHETLAPINSRIFFWETISIQSLLKNIFPAAIVCNILHLPMNLFHTKRADERQFLLHFRFVRVC